MAEKRLASGNIASTSLTTIYTVPSNSPILVYSFVLTNTTNNNISVDIYINDGTDRLLKSVTIPQGSGKTKSVIEVLGAYSGGDIIKLQAGSADSFNYLMTGKI